MDSDFQILLVFVLLLTITCTYHSGKRDELVTRSEPGVVCFFLFYLLRRAML